MSDNDETNVVDLRPIATADAEAALAPGARVGEYLIQREIASGGCGTVYQGVHRLLGRPAAVKVLHKEQATSRDMVLRFIREARIANQLRHPNIVDIYDFGELPDGRPFFVMELLEGSNLHDLVKRRGRLPPEEALSLLAPVCEALIAAHRQGIVHRDVKGSNILVLAGKIPADVKLLDFGIAKLLHPEPSEAGLTRAGQRLGSPQCTAPEQLRQEGVTERTDIYALGILLYFILVGSYPFQAADAAELERLHLEMPAPRPGASAPVSPAMDALILRCLEKDPQKRFPSVAALLEELRAAVNAAAPSQGKVERAASLAVYFDLTATEETWQSDEGLSALAKTMDEAERLLAASGFRIPLLTGGSVLGVRKLPAEAAEKATAVQTAVGLGKALLQLAARAPTAARPVAHVCVHVDEAEWTQAGAQAEVTGGRILEVEQWLIRGDDGASTTPAAVSAMKT